MAKTSGWGGYASIPQLNPQFVPQVSVPRVPVPMDSENIDVSKQSERAPSVNIASKKKVLAPTRRVAKIDKIREMSPEKSVVSSESNSKYFGYLNQIKNNLHFSIFPGLMRFAIKGRGFGAALLRKFINKPFVS